MNTVNFLCFLQYKTEVAHVLNQIPCILAYELGTNPVEFIMRSGMERATFLTWDPVQCILTDPNYLHKK